MPEAVVAAAPAAAVEPAKPAPVAAPATASTATPVWMQPPSADPAKPAAATPTDAAAKPAADPAKPAEPAKPEKVTIKAPEGVSVEAAVLEKFGADMSALGVTQDIAQKLFERQMAEQKASRDADFEAMKATNEKWGQQLKAEWGEKYVENAELTKRGFDFVDPDGSMRKELEGINAQNWPKLLNGIRKVGEMLREDKLHVPTTNAVPEKKLTSEQKLAEGYRERMGIKK